MSNNPDLDRDLETIKRTADRQQARSFANAETRPNTDAPADALPGEICTCPNLAEVDANCPTHGTARDLTVAYGDAPEAPRHPETGQTLDEWLADNGTEVKGEALPAEAQNPDVHPAWLDPDHPDAPSYPYVEIGSAADAIVNEDSPIRPTGDWARDVAEEAIRLFNGPRNADYGDATENFQDIGDLWAVVFGHPVSAEQVAICSALIKIARLKTSPHHDDSWVDATAYLALGGGIHRRRQA